MSYTYNKAPKDRGLLKSIRGAIVKDIRRNGLSMEDFAHEIGLSEGTLENKLKPACHTNDLTLSEFLHILDITADYKPLEYIAKRYGYTLCKPQTEETKEADAMDLAIKTLDLEATHGDLAKEVKEAVKDGVLDEEEKRAIREKAYMLRKLAAELEESVR